MAPPHSCLNFGLAEIDWHETILAQIDKLNKHNKLDEHSESKGAMYEPFHAAMSASDCATNRSDGEEGSRGTLQSPTPPLCP